MREGKAIFLSTSDIFRGLRQRHFHGSNNTHMVHPGPDRSSMPRDGGRKGNFKKPAASIQIPDDNVVFANNPKAGKKADGKEGDSKQEGKSFQVQGEETSKKPDTRALIGGASWTGKLPVNLLSEHCQKQKWVKPEYTMSKTTDGFSSMVILKNVNPKTKEVMTLPPFKLPPSHKHLANAPTAVEARHFAATYAMFRICSMRNIHMMLPPTYKGLWKNEFLELKKEDTKDGRGWMYEADPFTAMLEREEAKATMAKKREQIEKQKSEEAERPLVSLAGISSPSSTSSHGQNRHNVMRGWSKVPQIELGKKTRAQIEDLIQKKAVWNPNGVRIPEAQRRSITDEFTELGFRRSHVREATEECKDREEALEWLLIHVPEDDLPKWSLPENYTAGLSMASGNVKREAAIKRLASSGYSTDMCEKYLDDLAGDENLAAEALQDALVSSASRSPGAIDVSKLILDDANTDETVWLEEQETLGAIYGDRFRYVAKSVYEVQLQLEPDHSPITLQTRKSKAYPSQPPIIAIVAPAVPSYIRLSIIRQAVKYIHASVLGEPMIFSLVDWLEMEIPNILESPGKLRDVSGAISGDRVPAKRQTLSRNRVFKTPYPIDWNINNPKSTQMLNQWKAKQNTLGQQKMLIGRKSLPAWSLQNTIVDVVNSKQVTIISGETGSGKSTQSVQFVLDEMIQQGLGSSANIVCTQPRRISALGLADRVSEERCSKVGHEVGYIIRGESRQTPGATKITFMTTGVLLRRLQVSSSGKHDVVASLADVSHIFVDEVHERSLDTDCLLILLRDVLVRRKDLKIILMSATLDAGVFERYFETNLSVGHVEIQGRTYPVEDYYLDDVLRLTGFNISTRDAGFDDDTAQGPEGAPEVSVAGAIQKIGMRINYELIAATVRAIDSQLGAQEGGILIFLPGTMEITRTIAAIQSIPKLHALPLHASLTPAEQRRVFPPAPKGKRKVIVATNVAETSITIEDIVAVIDTGRVKETTFDPQNNMVKLEEVWASRAACKQRRGRAGRVRAGICYKLYTRNAEAKMSERPEPEIRRVPLEQLCLSVRAMGITNVPAFLASAPTPPEDLAVEGAIDLLGRIGALNGSELTALGKHLSVIPADLRCSKLMVYGATFGCLEASLTIAAILTVRSPFVSPQPKREESKAARTAFAPGHGDLVCDLRAYEAWTEVASHSSSLDTRRWCEKNFLSTQTLHDITSNKSQYLASLKEAGFLLPDYHLNNWPPANNLNAHNNNTSLIRALIAGSFNPQLARIEFPDKKFAASHSGAVELDPEARTIKYFNQENGRVFVHPSSTLFSKQTFPGGTVYLSYFNKMATSKVFIRELTPFNAYSALMFGGPVTLDTMGRGLLVDGWLRLRGWARIGVLVGRLRDMLDAVLSRKIEEPGVEITEDEVVKITRRLVEFDGLDR